MRRLFAFFPLALLAACATTPRQVAVPAGLREVQILAINDFHGNLEPPSLTYEGSKGIVPTGGAAYLATALKEVRTASSITVAAGDLISASPLVSSLFYDEPTIKALSDSGLGLASVGNHEFDRGPDELRRMQAGGCREQRAGDTRQSCKLEPFAGAKFQYLAANVIGRDGQTFFPSTAIRDLGGVRIGFIGMTLKETGTLVSPEGVRGLAFTDEATTANALVPYLRRAGARTIVLLIHQGGATTGKFDDPSCPGLSGDVLPIIEKLNPAIQLVVSGHTHNAYICSLPTAAGPRLLTSAGKYGALVTDIRMSFGADGSLAAQRAEFVPVQGEAIANARMTAPLNTNYRVFPADPQVAAMVQRYKAEAAIVANRAVGTLSAPLAKGDVSSESQASSLIADAQLYVARDAAKGAAEISFMNNGGARTDLIPGPGGVVTYGQIFAMQPFANNLVTITLTGADVKALLEQQFDSGLNSVSRPNLIMPSANVRFSFDRSRPAGQRIVEVLIDGKPIDPARRYRVAVNNFLASGGDNFTVLARGTNPVDGGLDLDATETYLKTNPKVPQRGRVIDLTPKDWTPPAK